MKISKTGGKVSMPELQAENLTDRPVQVKGLGSRACTSRPRAARAVCHDHPPERLNEARHSGCRQAQHLRELWSCSAVTPCRSERQQQRSRVALANSRLGLACHVPNAGLMERYVVDHNPSRPAL